MKGRDYARFFAKVKKVGDCWEWQVGTDKKGYGRFWLNGKNRQAYRVAYEFLIGPLASAFHLDHTCNNKLCVRPLHLEPVSLLENVAREDNALGRNCREKLTRQQIAAEIGF